MSAEDVSGDILCLRSPLGWLAKARHVPAGLIRSGCVVVAIRTQLVGPSALLILENNRLASHQHLSMVTSSGLHGEPFLGTHSAVGNRLFCFPLGSEIHFSCPFSQGS